MVCYTSNRCPSNNVQRTSLAARSRLSFRPARSLPLLSPSSAAPGSLRTRFSIIDSLTRQQDILLSDPRERYISRRQKRERERKIPGCTIRRRRFTLDKSRSRPPINNSPAHHARLHITQSSGLSPPPAARIIKLQGIKSASSCFKICYKHG